MAIGDGLCDPVTMTDYGDFLFGIGLIDEMDRDYFKKIADIQVGLIKKQKWVQAFQVSNFEVFQKAEFD
jgi:vitellogenic carboxypeptidase-like protein